MQTQCPSCDGLEQKPIVEGLTDIEYGVDGTFAVVQCGECDFRFLSPVPSVTYPVNYYTRWPGRRGWFPTLCLRVRYQLRWRRLKALAASDAKTIVEVGCGDGDFLRFLADKKGEGTELIGVDTHEPKADSRIRWIAEPIAKATLPPRIDLLFLYETLEHIEAPVQTLSRLKAALAPGGVIVGTVPRWGSLWHSLFPRHWQGLSAPRHLSFFEPKSLRQLLAKAGLELVTLRPILDPGDLSVTLANWICDRLRIKTPPRQTWFFFPLSVAALPIELLRLMAKRSGQIEFVARAAVR